MTDFLNRLAGYAQGRVPAVRYRARSRFEPESWLTPEWTVQPRSAAIKTLSRTTDDGRPRLATPGSDNPTAPAADNPLPEASSVPADEADGDPGRSTAVDALAQCPPDGDPFDRGRASEPDTTSAGSGSSPDRTGEPPVSTDRSPMRDATHPARLPGQHAASPARIPMRDATAPARRSGDGRPAGRGRWALEDSTDSEAQLHPELLVRSTDEILAPTPVNHVRSAGPPSIAVERDLPQGSGAPIPAATGRDRCSGRGGQAQPPVSVPVPSFEELLHEHVVPALADAGLLTPGRPTVVRRSAPGRPRSDFSTGGRPPSHADVVTADEPDAMAAPTSGTPRVHVAIANVQIVRPPDAAPSPPAPAPAGPDHEAYLARRRQRP